MYLKEAEEDALSEDKGILTVTTRHCRNEKESFAKTHGTVTKDKKKMAWSQKQLRTAFRLQFPSRLLSGE